MTALPRLLDVLRELRQELRPTVRRLSRRCGKPGMFRTSGRVHLRLAPDATVHPPGARTWLGLSVDTWGADPGAWTVVSVGSGGSLRLDGAQISRGCTIKVGAGAAVEVGRGTYLNDRSQILASQRITIGCNCQISFDVLFLDDDGHGFGPPPYSAPIVVEDDVWIGCRAVVLKGVTLGAGSVVAAGAVVTRSCPPRSLLAGVPARIVREGVHWTDAARSVLSTS